MYPVSDKFMEEVQKNTRTFYWTGSIVTKNHQTYPFGNEDIVKGSGYITRQCCGSTEIELGTVYAAEMGISLYSDVDRYTLDGAEIRLSFHLVYGDGTEEEVPMGVFEVSEANRAIRCLELKAYDYMLRFDKTLKLNASSGTAYNFLASACNDCKVELAHSREEIEQMPNGKEVLGIYSDNDIETYRDLLYYTAQVLGCFCRIDREGRLELVPYGTTPVMDIPTTQRFDSSYSDFVTRYTAVSSTNMRTETAEYYALDVDDGLTLNLGVNPLLQFGLKTTRERILRNILDRIVVVDYVPFDSTTIGNPALDPGDILTFSGGHADESKISCITGITYKVNGKHSLKCVGKNPKLSNAKSRNEKNISGLLNTVEAGKIVVYNFTNVSPFKIGTSPTEVLSITFTSKEETTAQFLAELLLEVTADEVEKKITGTAQYEDAATEDDVADTPVKKPVTYSFTEKGQAELTVIYKMNLEEVENFKPTKTCIDGKHILTLFLPITQVVANSENTLSVYLKMTGGTLNIGEAQIRATISGQGLVAGIGDWNGRINITENIDRIGIGQVGLVADPIKSDVVSILYPAQSRSAITQSIVRIAFGDSDFSYDLLNERLTVMEVIKTFTVDANFPPQYNRTMVELNEKNAFCMVSDYTFVSAAEAINRGMLQHLAVNTEQFERVEKLEVAKC